jgi:hypothetical protein
MPSNIAISANLTSTLTDIYTVLTGKIATIEHIDVNSISAGTIRVTRYQASDSTAYNIFPTGTPITALGSREKFQYRLLAGDKIQASGPTDAVIHIVGLEQDA